MCDLVIWDGRAVFVYAAHEIPDHILAIFFSALGASCIDDIRIYLCHLPLRYVPLSICWQGKPGKHEINGLETVV